MKIMIVILLLCGFGSVIANEIEQNNLNKCMEKNSFSTCHKAFNP